MKSILRQQFCERYRKEWALYPVSVSISRFEETPRTKLPLPRLQALETHEITALKTDISTLPPTGHLNLALTYIWKLLGPARLLRKMPEGIGWHALILKLHV